MKRCDSRQAAFTLVEIMIVAALIGLLAAIALPNFVKARQISQRGACIANLKQIDTAKAAWALEQKKDATDSPTAADLYGPDRYIRYEPFCPGGGGYQIERVDAKPGCGLSSAPNFHTL